MENTNGIVELHAHVFMKEGLGRMFRGSFDGPLCARGWKDRFRSKINEESLEKSGIKILVVALYAHPLLVRSLRDSIRSQIDKAENFATRNPNWVLALNAAEARQAISEGKRIMILSLEGASGILDTEEDLEEFIDRRGIRIVTPFHFTDDAFGGAAFLRGVTSVANFPALARQILNRHSDNGIRVNNLGLSARGRKLIKDLLSRKVWIDLAHASDKSQEEIIEMLKKAGQPLLYTHTVLRRHHKAERAISDSQLEEVRKTQGLVGLMPCDDMINGDISVFRNHYEETAAVIGSSPVMIGSDLNGGITHLKPGGNSGTSLDQEGFWNIGQTSELWKALGAAAGTIEHFLNAWAQCVGTMRGND